MPHRFHVPHGGRAMSVIVAGAALAAVLLVPIAAEVAGSTGPAAVVVGFASCPGLTFQPATDAPYRNDGTLGKAESQMRCPISLPHGATVTAVRFAVFDNQPGLGVNGCFLGRAHIDLPNKNPDIMAGPMATVGTVGDSVLKDASIAFNLVDNRHYGYWVECATYDDPGIGIYGVTIRYTLPA